MRRFRETTALGIMAAALAVVAWSTLSRGQTPGGGPPPRRGGGNGGFAGNGPPDPPPDNNNRPDDRDPGERLIAQVGQAVFFDTNISNPVGMSCSSCHAPETGFSYPVSLVNQLSGTVPGVIHNRFGNRKPMTISYSWFVPDGPTFWRRRERAWVGGFFSDGRADSLEAQARMPMLNPNEMDNVVHGLASPDLVVRKVEDGAYTDLFKEAFGADAFTKSSDTVFEMIRQSIDAFERSRAVSPFSSKYDAYVQGVAQLTTSELNGLRLFTGSVTGRLGGAPNYKDAECVTCHTISDDDTRHDFFTNWTFANVGVPKNSHNPFYKQTNAAIDPQGFNPDGDRYVDLGLGAVLYPQHNLPPGNIGPGGNGRGDYLECNGEFRVPSLRNVDKRPSPDFVKCYMHNGVFKSLKQVVHFYNTRNLTTAGEIVDWTNLNPTAHLKGKPLWPAPEYPSAITMQNPRGLPNGPDSRVGNLGLTEQEENDLVAFLGTLSDGYFTPQRRRPPAD
jgi:cytochrome c peroxidase